MAKSNKGEKPPANKPEPRVLKSTRVEASLLKTVKHIAVELDIDIDRAWDLAGPALREIAATCSASQTHGAS